MSRHREARRSRLLVAAATVALVIAAAGALAGPGPTSSAQAAAPFTVTVSQTQGLADGQLVDVAVGLRADLVAVDATAYVCRPGQTYTAAAHIGQNAGNCPVAVPLSGAGGETSNWRLHLFTGGARARGDVVIGVGTAEWDSTVTTDRFSLTCGPTSPCALVVRVQARPAAGGSIQQLFDASTTLTYRETDPLATCGGAATGALRTAGAERMLDAWREWTLGHCGDHPGGAATMAPLPEEGAALTDFTEGERDVVYTAAGPGEPGFSPSTSRATTPTPVAVNAVVLAAAGGHFVGDDPERPPTLRRPYDGLRLTPEEVAVMLGQGQHHLALTRGAEVLARNPQLGALHPTINSKPPFALSGATATSLYMTRYLDQVAGNAWTAGPEFGLAPRGVTANLGVPESPGETTFANALSIVSDPSLIARATTTRLLEISPTNLGPYWVWTDLATATRLGLTPVSLQNADGEWVAPTPESLAAAVPTMTRQPNGMLVPDVDTTAPGAYPLTIVEYALAPTELLADGDCTPRSESQALLTSWLTYITGDGQADLPAGFLPLTPALREEARAAILRVGSEEPDGCVVVPPTTPPTTGPTITTTTTLPPASPDDGFDDGRGGGGSGLGDDEGGAGPHGGTEPRESTDEDRDEALEAVDDAEVATAPPFAGIAALNELLSPLSLLLIVAMTSGAAFLTSGREPPPVLRASGRAVAGGVGATGRWLASPRLPGVGRPAFARRPR